MRKSIMWKYMAEEQDILQGMIEKDDIKDKLFEYKPSKTIYIICHGSSYNAAVTICNFISKATNCKVHVYTPANFIWNCHNIELEECENTIVIGISQTGNSRGTYEALQKAKKLHFKVISITNSENTLISNLSDTSLLLDCGEENSNAKTKGYSATVLLLLLIGIYLGVHKGIVTKEKEKQYLSVLRENIKEIDSVKRKVVTYCEQQSFGKDMNQLFVIGNGMNFGSALEGQLKIMETMCIPTMFNDIEEFSHGMHRAINTESFVLLLNTNIGSDLMVKTYEYLKQKTSHVLMLNTGQPLHETNTLDFACYNEIQSVFTMITAIQTLSVFIPELNGQDPNMDSNNDYTDFVSTRI